jgi:hypothetical protein
MSGRVDVHVHLVPADSFALALTPTAFPHRLGIKTERIFAVTQHGLNRLGRPSPRPVTPTLLALALALPGSPTLTGGTVSTLTAALALAAATPTAAA